MMKPTDELTDIPRTLTEPKKKENVRASQSFRTHPFPLDGARRLQRDNGRAVRLSPLLHHHKIQTKSPVFGLGFLLFGINISL